MKISSIVVLLCGVIISCVNNSKLSSFKTDQLFGSWNAVINEEYNEVHFLDNNKMIPINEEELYYADTIAYYLTQDSVEFLNRIYKYSYSGDTLILSNEEFGEIKLFRLELPSKISSDILFNGYMIRRANFMVNHKYLIPKEANQQFYDYINEQRMLDTMDVEEEYLN